MVPSSLITVSIGGTALSLKLPKVTVKASPTCRIWEDCCCTLSLAAAPDSELAPGVVVAYERNAQTNARLQEAGIDVLTIAGSELGTGRGGPRCMSCPVARDLL